MCLPWVLSDPLTELIRLHVPLRQVQEHRVILLFSILPRGPQDCHCACSPETFCESFFVFAREFCIEKRRGFLVNFFWSPFPTKGSTKTPRIILGKFGAKSGAKFGTKIRKIRGTFVLQLSDLKD